MSPEDVCDECVREIFTGKPSHRRISSADIVTLYVQRNFTNMSIQNRWSNSKIS